MSQPLIIKKYTNRRLYNTETSAYITLADLVTILRGGHDVQVVDAKTGNDLTQSTLAYVVLEEDARGAALLSSGFMKSLIRLYDDPLQIIVPYYLEMAMLALNENRDDIKYKINDVLGDVSPFASTIPPSFSREQLDKLQKVLGLFNPFNRKL